MYEDRSIDKLAKWIMRLALAAVLVWLCWYFRTTLIYIVLAAVVSLICRPVKKFLGKLRVKGRSAPDGVLAILSIVIILLLLGGVVTQIIPIAAGIISNASSNFQKAQFSTGAGFAGALAGINQWLTDTFPNVGADFRLETFILGFIRDSFDTTTIGDSIGNVVGSVASAVGSVGVGLFCVIFISFFFVKDDRLFRKMVGALVPDGIEAEVYDAISDIEQLLTRYFVGLISEVVCVAAIVFVGTMLCGLNFTAAVGIAFIAGLLNIIPYLGPWIGGAIGVVLGLVLKYSAAAAAGVSLNFIPIAAALTAVFIVSQMVDNYVLQPVIYSASLRTHPLEIFIVMLLAGHIGGIIGMLVAIPAYTVARVVASRFFLRLKPVRRLIGSTKDGAQDGAQPRPTSTEPTENQENEA